MWEEGVIDFTLWSQSFWRQQRTILLAMFRQHSSGMDTQGPRWLALNIQGPMSQHKMANTGCPGNLKQATIQSGIYLLLAESHFCAFHMTTALEVRA